MCGIYAIYSAITSQYINLQLLKGMQLIQHRGQDSYGVCYYDDFKNEFNVIKNKGLIKSLNTFHSNCCLGHLRYSTSGKTIKKQSLDVNEIQPLKGNFNENIFFLSHNGNIPKVNIFDSEYLLNSILTYNGTFEKSLINLISTMNAAYSIVIAFKDKLYLIRDRFGVRPLCYGKINEFYHVSSETCAFTDNFEFIKNVEPGQILRIDNVGVTEIFRHREAKLCLCSFELIYLSSENSIIDGYNVKNIRSKLSHMIAKKDINFLDKDYCVVGIPLTGILLGKEYANYLKLNYSQYIIKNKKSNRTFIQPSHSDRVNACNEKFLFSDNITNKKIIIVDDSIVRGNVIKNIIKKLRELNVKEVHVRIPSPPVKDICYLGISIKDKNELIINNRTVQQVCDIIGADSLKYLTVNELRTVMPRDSYDHCFSSEIDRNLII